MPENELLDDESLQEQITIEDSVFSDCYKQDEDTIQSNLPKSNEVVKIDSALAKSDNKSLQKHNDCYTELLESYVDNTRKTLEYKTDKKDTIFNVTVIMFTHAPIFTIIMIFAFVAIAICREDVSFLDILPEVLVSFGSLLATYFTVFKMITGYIFNKDEEKNMTDIISKIQEYDTMVRNQNNNDEIEE